MHLSLFKRIGEIWHCQTLESCSLPVLEPPMPLLLNFIQNIVSTAIKVYLALHILWQTSYSIEWVPRDFGILWICCHPARYYSLDCAKEHLQIAMNLENQLQFWTCSSTVFQYTDMLTIQSNTNFLINSGNTKFITQITGMLDWCCDVQWLILMVWWLFTELLFWWYDGHNLTVICVYL
jgi:hypothetical protein